MQIINVLPALLGTYGDNGNVVVLQRRLSWRGIAVDVMRTTVRDPLPRSGDLYVFGGGEDWAQDAALTLLRKVPNGWLLDGPAPVLAVCAGLQLLGRELPDPQAGRKAGLGLTDLSTTRGSRRVLGEVIARAELGLADELLTGFANHSGRTRLGPGIRPLASVIQGEGNDGGDAEGALDRALIGSYLHGPLLARNPDLADYILSRVLRRPLEQLPPSSEQQLHAQRLGPRWRGRAT